MLVKECKKKIRKIRIENILRAISSVSSPLTRITKIIIDKKWRKVIIQEE